MTATQLAETYGVRITRRDNLWVAVETIPGGRVLARGLTLAALRVKLDRLFS